MLEDSFPVADSFKIADTTCEFHMKVNILYVHAYTVLALFGSNYSCNYFSVQYNAYNYL